MSIRTERVARLVQRDVADILQGELARELSTLVTVTNVRMTKDLSIAYINVSVMGTTAAEQKATFRHLVEIAPTVRRAFAARVRNQVRSVPDLKFFLDESMETALHLDTIFARIAEERGDPPAPDAGEVDSGGSADDEADD